MNQRTKWGGIGCGTLIALMIICGIIATLLPETEDPSPVSIDSDDLLLSTTDWRNASGLVDRQDSIKYAQEQRQARQEEAKARQEEAKRRASFAWSSINLVDEWGDIEGKGAVSKTVSPDRSMGFPYNDVTARLMVSCRSAWIRFSSAPNLTGGDTESGYDRYYIKVQIDGNETRWRATQSWGDDDINLPSSARNTFARGQRFRVVLPWYGEGSVVFSWDLTGASDMISQTCTN